MIGTRLFFSAVFTTYYFVHVVRGFSLSTPRRAICHHPTLSTIQRLALQSPNEISSSSATDHVSKTSQAKMEMSVRAQLRAITGFSLTAVRATMRAATGISFTALCLSALAISGVWIRQTMRVILDLFPTWARYFVQPVLVLYYVPLFMLRNMTAPKRREQEMTHKTLVESWKQSVDIADHSTSYWPIHLNEDGEIESVKGEIDVNDAVAKSVEIALEIKRDS